jgi:DNA adenine methylase
MILRRLGNKQAIASDIIKHFPKHTCYCEPFFGAGGLFFNKQPAKYNYLNDIDSDVHNLFIQLMTNKEELKNWIQNIPYHKDTWNWFKKLIPENDMMKAVKFVILSNYGYMGKPNTIHFTLSNSKNELLKNIESTFNFLISVNTQFNNVDFRKFIEQFSIKSKRDKNDINNTFWYLDPPYIGTGNNYSDSFIKQDSVDLFDCIQKTGCKFAYSEFDNPFILNQAKERGLNVITIGDRQNIKNRRIEILITNYDLHPTLW